MSQESSSSRSARLTELESAVAHHQRDYDQLNQAVVDQAAVIDQLKRRVAQVEELLQAVMTQLPERERDVDDDKPPHY